MDWAMFSAVNDVPKSHDPNFHDVASTNKMIFFSGQSTGFWEGIKKKWRVGGKNSAEAFFPQTPRKHKQAPEKTSNHGNRQAAYVWSLHRGLMVKGEGVKSGKVASPG
ncbi:hypothetical protein NPIL_578291 [Nephila pilipes]|uniref:Uncharacterized protein n=1 Tax=Nephila pilipes TaxID=299642 RepID=A0A8X6TWH0_NEPPI|nr:hypothetical protein NPIL_578291 [Nephila pilipes]